MSTFEFFSVLSSRKLLLTGIFSAIVGAGMAITFMLSPTYQSTMKILVTRDRVDPQVTPTEKTPDYSRGELTEEDLNSEIEILQSRSVLEGVARQVGFDKMYAETPRGWFARFRARLSDSYRSFHGQAAPDPMERAIAQISGDLEVVSIKKSRIIKVTYRDSSPERAAQVLNELYHQYAEQHLRLLQTSKASNVFHEQSAEFDQKLKEATEALKRFDARTGATASGAQQGLQLQRLYEAQNQLDKARTEIRETEERIATLKGQIEAQPERIESEARTKYVAALDKIKDEILTLELQRTQLLQKYQPNHRLVNEVDERLAQAREMLAREEKSPPQERSTVLNEIRRHLTSELLLAQAGLAPLREREQSLTKLTEQYREQATNIDAKSLERANLERARAVNEEAFLLYRKKAQESDILTAMNRERIVNFSLAEAPGVNRAPIAPKPLINFAALAVVGLAAAIAIVAFIERNRLALAETTLLATDPTGLPPLSESDRALAMRWMAVLSGSSTPPAIGADRQLAGGKESALQLAAQTANDSAGKGPEAWRVKAVVEYLHGVFSLPSGELSGVLRETVGWEISQAEIDEMLSTSVRP
jgi:uncharacterized protein involved in exopolysaccharide biosynthesis